MISLSNSYGGGESGSSGFSTSYTHAGITVTASSGDSGFAGDAQFQVFGGTSVAAPLIAGIIGSTGAGIDPTTVYSRVAANPSLVFDVTSGTNGPCSGKPAYFCNGAAGFDGPTGLGMPNGPGAL